MGITLKEAKQRREQYIKEHKTSGLDNNNWWAVNLPFYNFLWDGDHAVSLDSIINEDEIKELKIVFDIPGKPAQIQDDETSFSFIFDAIFESFQVNTISKKQLQRIKLLWNKIDQEKLKSEEQSIRQISNSIFKEQKTNGLCGVYSRIAFLQAFGKYYPKDNNIATEDANRKDDKFFPYLRECIEKMGGLVNINLQDNTLIVLEDTRNKYMGRNIFLKNVILNFFASYNNVYISSTRNNYENATIKNISGTLKDIYNCSYEKKTVKNTLEYLMHLYILGTPEAQPLPFYPAPNIYGSYDKKNFFQKYPYYQLFGKVSDRFCVDWFVPTKAKKDFIVFNGRFRVRWLLHEKYLQEINGETYPGRQCALEEYNQELLNFKFFLNPFLMHKSSYWYFHDDKIIKNNYNEKYHISPRHSYIEGDFSIPRLNEKKLCQFQKIQKQIREKNLKILLNVDKNSKPTLIFDYDIFNYNLLQDAIGEYVPYLLPIYDIECSSMHPKNDYEDYIGRPVLYNPLKMLMRNNCTIIKTYNSKSPDCDDKNVTSALYL